MKTVAIIPARGGSKRLPGKNLALLDGKPLILYTIAAASDCPNIEETHVSSDSAAILELARTHGASPIQRPVELSGDTVLMDPVVDHAIRELGLATDDIVVLLQPTSPLRQAEHVTEALRLFAAPQGGPVVSMKEASECPFKGFLVAKGRATGYFGRNAPFSRQQDFPELLYANGAIYIFTVGQFRKHGCIPRDDIVPYLMGWEHSIDIDTSEDLELAAVLLERRRE